MSPRVLPRDTTQLSPPLSVTPTPERESPERPQNKVDAFIARHATPFRIWAALTILWCVFDGYDGLKKGVISSALFWDVFIPPFIGWIILKGYTWSHPKPTRKEPSQTFAVINPARWKLEHQIAWTVACAIGSMIGLVYGLARMPQPLMPSTYVWSVWLQHTEYYSHWVLFGGAIAGLAFYFSRLIKS
jgi:hypothetical protein